MDEQLAVVPALTFATTALLLFGMSLSRDRSGRVIAYLLLVPAFVSITAALELLGVMTEGTKVFFNAAARTAGTLYGLYVAWHWRM